VNLDSFRESSISEGLVKALYGLAAMDCQVNDLCALLSKLPILSNSDLNLTLYSCELAASCHANQDSLVCENLLSLHPFPSSQEENVDEVTEETVVSKELTKSLITSQVITSFSQKIIQSLNGDASELIEEAKEKAKKVPQGSVQ